MPWVTFRLEEPDHHAQAPDATETQPAAFVIVDLAPGMHMIYARTARIRPIESHRAAVDDLRQVALVLAHAWTARLAVEPCLVRLAFFVSDFLDGDAMEYRKRVRFVWHFVSALGVGDALRLPKPQAWAAICKRPETVRLRRVVSLQERWLVPILAGGLDTTTTSTARADAAAFEADRRSGITAIELLLRTLLRTSRINDDRNSSTINERRTEEDDVRAIDGFRDAIVLDATKRLVVFLGEAKAAIRDDMPSRWWIAASWDRIGLEEEAARLADAFLKDCAYVGNKAGLNGHAAAFEPPVMDTGKVTKRKWDRPPRLMAYGRARHASAAVASGAIGGTATGGAAYLAAGEAGTIAYTGAVASHAGPVLGAKLMSLVAANALAFSLCTGAIAGGGVAGGVWLVLTSRKSALRRRYLRFVRRLATDMVSSAIERNVEAFERFYYARTVLKNVQDEFDWAESFSLAIERLGACHDAQAGVARQARAAA